MIAVLVLVAWYLRTTDNRDRSWSNEENIHFAEDYSRFMINVISLTDIGTGAYFSQRSAGCLLEAISHHLRPVCCKLGGGTVNFVIL